MFSDLNCRSDTGNHDLLYMFFSTEMETVNVLRLAHLHNQTDKVHHEMNSKEKVTANSEEILNHDNHLNSNNNDDDDDLIFL